MSLLSCNLTSEGITRSAVVDANSCIGSVKPLGGIKYSSSHIGYEIFFGDMKYSSSHIEEAIKGSFVDGRGIATCSASYSSAFVDFPFSSSFWIAKCEEVPREAGFLFITTLMLNNFGRERLNEN